MLFSPAEPSLSVVCVMYVILQKVSHDIRMMVIERKEKGAEVITSVERCLMICAKMPVSINYYPAEAACVDVPVWKTGQSFS